jgi:hypothetical protein
LTSVTNLSATPQNVDNYVFSNINTRACILKVPASAVNTYRAVPVWRHFGNIVANE